MVMAAILEISRTLLQSAPVYGHFECFGIMVTIVTRMGDADSRTVCRVNRDSVSHIVKIGAGWAQERLSGADQSTVREWHYA